jgi:phosphoribosyl 1,2-cyclic phosphodiesterase
MVAMLFQMWGTRGGRNDLGSRIGTRTSCYSFQAGEDLYVFDAGSGLVSVADALLTDARLRGVTRVSVFVTHAHLDHWEGLKDASWMWRPKNGLQLTLFGPTEALGAIRGSLAPPGFVSLEILALGTLAAFSYVELAADASVALPGATLHTVRLHHYSGIAPNRRHLDTLGYRLAVDGGPGISYLSDHEPIADTRAVEDQVLSASNLAIVDANYSDIGQHAFGHGSIEYAADLARRHPAVQVLAGHHGPMRTDQVIEDAMRRHGAGLPNLLLAVQRGELRWDGQARRFEPGP